jgi:hypothetical protein
MGSSPLEFGGSVECRTIRQKPFRQIAENRFGKVAELSPMKLPIRQKSIRQLCKYKSAAKNPTDLFFQIKMDLMPTSFF